MGLWAAAQPAVALRALAAGPDAAGPAVDNPCPDEPVQCAEFPRDVRFVGQPACRAKPSEFGSAVNCRRVGATNGRRARAPTHDGHVAVGIEPFVVAGAVVGWSFGA